MPDIRPPAPLRCLAASIALLGLIWALNPFTAGVAACMIMYASAPVDFNRHVTSFAAGLAINSGLCTTDLSVYIMAYLIFLIAAYADADASTSTSIRVKDQSIQAGTSPDDSECI